jgi:hypothetical protein
LHVPCILKARNAKACCARGELSKYFDPINMQSKNNNEILSPLGPETFSDACKASAVVKVKFEIHIRRFHNGLFIIHVCGGPRM